MVEILDDLKILLSPDWSVGDVTLAHVKLGDSYKDINRSIVTDGQLHQVSQASGTTLKDKLLAVIKQGGWIRCEGGVAFRLENEVVAEMAIQTDTLKALDIKYDSEIVDNLGEPDRKSDFSKGVAIEGTEYYYAKQKLFFVWSKSFNTLLSVNIGERHKPEQ